MSRNENEHDPGLRQIPTWARRYAQNRTLPFIVLLVICILAPAMFGGLGYLAGYAYIHGHRVLAAAAVLALAGWTIFWVWFSVVGARQAVEPITRWLYRREGGVLPDTSLVRAQDKGLTWAAYLFSFCIIASVGLGLLGFIPERYMQPVSAIYMVPFMLYILYRLRGTSSPFMFLWPVLYAAHAILITVGVPISRGPVFDMLFPVFGYGLMVGLLGHAYSRFALRKLRALSAGRGKDGEDAGEL